MLLCMFHKTSPENPWLSPFSVIFQLRCELWTWSFRKKDIVAGIFSETLEKISQHLLSWSACFWEEKNSIFQINYVSLDRNMLKVNATSTKITLSDIILALFYFATTLFQLELWIHHSNCSKTYTAVDAAESWRFLCHF